MRNVEQNARICLLMGTWLEILDVAHVILCGDDRFIMCTDDHLSACFASLCAIGQIAKQLIFVSITPQESIPVRRNRRSCNHVLPLCVIRSLVDCFRMYVRYLSQTRSTLLIVSSREVIYGRNICWHLPTPQMFDKPGPDHKYYAQLKPRPIPWHVSQDEYFLVVRTLLSIPLGPISIHVAVSPYQKCIKSKSILFSHTYIYIYICVHFITSDVTE